MIEQPKITVDGADYVISIKRDGGGKFIAVATTPIERREIESEPMGTEGLAKKDLTTKLRKQIQIEVERQKELAKLRAWNEGRPR